MAEPTKADMRLAVYVWAAPTVKDAAQIIAEAHADERRKMAFRCVAHEGDEAPGYCVCCLAVALDTQKKILAQEREAARNLIALARGAAEALSATYPYEAAKVHEACARVEALMGQEGAEHADPESAG